MENTLIQIRMRFKWEMKVCLFSWHPSVQYRFGNSLETYKIPLIFPCASKMSVSNEEHWDWLSRKSECIDLWLDIFLEDQEKYPGKRRQVALEATINNLPNLPGFHLWSHSSARLSAWGLVGYTENMWSERPDWNVIKVLMKVGPWEFHGMRVRPPDPWMPPPAKWLFMSDVPLGLLPQKAVAGVVSRLTPRAAHKCLCLRNGRCWHSPSIPSSGWNTHFLHSQPELIKEVRRVERQTPRSESI